MRTSRDVLEDLRRSAYELLALQCLSGKMAGLDPFALLGLDADSLGRNRGECPGPGHAAGGPSGPLTGSRSVVDPQIGRLLTLVNEIHLLILELDEKTG